MNRTIRHAAVFSLLLVLALLVRATWLQTYDAEALADQEKNRRNTIDQYAQPLGDIVVAGAPVTGSKSTTGSDLAYQRTYTDGPLYAAVTGYSSQAYGATQLEGIHSKVLDGTDDRLKDPVDALLDKQLEPGDVLTTIDPEVQRAGYEALGDIKGAAVAIDPKTGKILGMVSTPPTTRRPSPGSTTGSSGASSSRTRTNHWSTGPFGSPWHPAPPSSWSSRRQPWSRGSTTPWTSGPTAPSRTRFREPPASS